MRLFSPRRNGLRTRPAPAVDVVIRRHHSERAEVMPGIVAVIRPPRPARRSQRIAARRACRRNGGHFFHQKGWSFWWCCACPAVRYRAPAEVCADCRGCSECLGVAGRAAS